MKVHRAVPLAVLAAVCGILLGADDPADPLAEKLGEGWATANAGEKLAMISVGKADKAISFKEAGEGVESVTLSEVSRGRTAEARIKLLADARTIAQTRLKAINAERKAGGKKTVSLSEPPEDVQNALALAFIAETIGGHPTLEQLEPLKVVRASTSWVAHHKLVLGAVQDAVARDPGYAEADVHGKLGIIKDLAEREVMGFQERAYLEQAVLESWLAASLAAGTSAKELAGIVKEKADAKDLSLSASSWAQKILARLVKLQALAPAPSGGGDGKPDDEPKPDEDAKPGDEG